MSCVTNLILGIENAKILFTEICNFQMLTQVH